MGFVQDQTHLGQSSQGIFLLEEIGRWPTERSSKRGYEVFVLEKAERAEAAAADGRSRGLYTTVRELGARERAGLEKVILEDGSVAQDTRQEQRWWLDHFSAQLGRTAAAADTPILAEVGLLVDTACQPPSYCPPQA